MKPEKLTHLDSAGEARMVDVGDKEATRRVAKAGARIRMSPATREQIAGDTNPKGAVLSTARLAGIQAAKRTSELIPLCHPLPLEHVEIVFGLMEGDRYAARNSFVVKAELGKSEAAHDH